MRSRQILDPFIFGPCYRLLCLLNAEQRTAVAGSLQHSLSEIAFVRLQSDCGVAAPVEYKSLRVRRNQCF